MKRINDSSFHGNLRLSWMLWGFPVELQSKEREEYSLYMGRDVCDTSGLHPTEPVQHLFVPRTPERARGPVSAGRYHFAYHPTLSALGDYWFLKASRNRPFRADCVASQVQMNPVTKMMPSVAASDA